MIKAIEKFMNKPELYLPGTNKIFWTDDHISKHLLEAHLSQNTDASSRKLEFIDDSVQWITQVIPPTEFPKLLDLGCGAGLYAERFSKYGYDVTGIDFSQRSINYAKEQSMLNKSNINYLYQDYLTIDFESQFDVVTLIYCDFGALSDNDRKILLQKAYKSLKPNGKFILDVFTLNVFCDKKEEKVWSYFENGGFWSPQPHICLEANYLYHKNNTELRQYIIQTDEKTECYNIWEHYFSKDDLIKELKSVGFKLVELYDDISGKNYSEESQTLCGIFSK